MEPIIGAASSEWLYLIGFYNKERPVIEISQHYELRHELEQLLELKDTIQWRRYAAAEAQGVFSDVWPDEDDPEVEIDA